MRSRKGLIAGGVIAAAIMGWVMLGPGAGGSDSTGADGLGGGAGAREQTGAGHRPATEEHSGPERREDPRVRAQDPEVRALARALRERIETARTARETAAAAAPAAELRSPVETGGSAVNGSDQAEGRLDPEYIRDAIRELSPLVAECYDLALEEDGTLRGRLVLEFDIEGEPDVGGVVGDSTVSEESTLTHPTLDECVRETMYTLELPAPEGGGMVHVRYPFTFTTEEAEGGER